MRDDDARRICRTYHAWMGLALLEDFRGVVAQLTGCAQTEADAVWEARLDELRQRYAALTDLPYDAAWLALDESDLDGEPGLLPPIIGHPWSLGRDW